MQETHPEIINTAISGGWQRAYLTNSSLRLPLIKLFNRAKSQKHPIIYINEWANNKGESPTPNQLPIVIVEAEAYYRGSDPAMAEKIDRFRTPHPSGPNAQNRSFPKYVWNKEKKRISKTRIARGLTFCKSLRKRIALLPNNSMAVPLQVPLIELGVTADMLARLKQHSEHCNFNPIMNLFDAIAGLRWRGEYRLCQFVIHSCCGPDRVALAEILFTHLCEGYISNAGGFGTHPAGQSVVAAYKQHHTGWEQAEDWAVEHMCVAETHRAERKLWEERLGHGRGLPDDSLADEVNGESEYDEALRCYSNEQLQELTSGLKDQTAEVNLSGIFRDGLNNKKFREDESLDEEDGDF